VTRDLIYSVIAGIVVAVATVSAGHALLSKRDPRAALGWITVCVLFPLFGPLFYFAFGINRIRMRAQKLVAAESNPATEPLREGHMVPAVPDALVQRARRRSLTSVPLRPAIASAAPQRGGVSCDARRDRWRTRRSLACDVYLRDQRHRPQVRRALQRHEIEDCAFS
jgi:hypothetical protein